MTEPMKRGALARVINPTIDLARPGKTRRYARGFEFVVEDFVPDGEVAGEPCVFYWGSANGGVNNVAVLAADVKQVKSGEEMAARELPEAKQVLDFILSALLDEHDGLEIDQTSLDNREIIGYGTTADGLDFGFAIPVTEVKIWRTEP